jgi:MYXO-CTERM domain-containing protein
MDVGADGGTPSDGADGGTVMTPDGTDGGNAPPTSGHGCAMSPPRSSATPSLLLLAIALLWARRRPAFRA